MSLKLKPKFVFGFTLGATIGLVVGMNIELITNPQRSSPDATHTETLSSIDTISPIKGHIGSTDSGRLKATPAPEHLIAELPSFEKFRALISEQKFDQAMLLYNATELEDSNLIPRYRNYVLATLNTHVGNSDIFAALANSYLDSYYDDVDVLMLIAAHEASQNHLQEASQTFEFAFQSAHSDREQRDVQGSFNTFVLSSDSHIEDNFGVNQLYDFYSYINNLSVSTNAHKLRLAQISIVIGYEDVALTIFSDLINDTRYAETAKQALSKLSSNNTPQPHDQNWEQSISISARGSSYIVDAVLNGSDTVSLLLDTGASITTLSLNQFTQLSSNYQFEYVGEGIFNTAGGTTTGKIYRAESLQLGDFVVTGSKIVVLDTLEDDSFSGLLGMNILSKFHFQINQDQNTLNLKRRHSK